MERKSRTESELFTELVTDQEHFIAKTSRAVGQTWETEDRVANLADGGVDALNGGINLLDPASRDGHPGGLKGHTNSEELLNDSVVKIKSDPFVLVRQTEPLKFSAHFTVFDRCSDRAREHLCKRDVEAPKLSVSTTSRKHQRAMAALVCDEWHIEGWPEIERGDLGRRLVVSCKILDRLRGTGAHDNGGSARLSRKPHTEKDLAARTVY